MTPYEQLKEICQSKQATNRLLIICPDVVRRERSLEFAVNSICKDQNKLAIQKFDASALSIEALKDLKESSNNLSLFSSQKFILIKDIDKLTVALQTELENIISQDSPSNTFIFTASSAPAKSILFKAFSKKETVDFPKLEGQDLLKWVAQEFKRQGCNDVDSKAIQLVTAIGLEDLDLICPIIEKLSLYSDSEKITPESVKALDTFQEKAQEFNFVNLLAGSKKTPALLYVEELKRSGVSTFPLMGLISKMFSNYLRLKVAESASIHSNTVTKDLALSPWALKKQSEISRTIKEQKLLRCLRAIIRADSQLKNKNLSESAILMELINNAN